eukprot:5218368-Prymnesium_polylepis.1
MVGTCMLSSKNNQTRAMLPEPNANRGADAYIPTIGWQRSPTQKTCCRRLRPTQHIVDVCARYRISFDARSRTITTMTPLLT